MSTDLLFTRVLVAGHPVDLVFGRPIGPVLDAEGAFDIQFPPISASFEGLLDYDNAVSRSDVIGASAGWQASIPASAGPTRAVHGNAEHVRTSNRLPWGTGAAVKVARIADWQQLASIYTRHRPHWQSGESLRQLAVSSWQVGDRLRRAARNQWQVGVPGGAGAASSWQLAVILRPNARRVPWGWALPLPRVVGTSAQSADRAWQRPSRIRWSGAERLPAGKSARTVPPVEPIWRCYTLPAGSAVHLLFDERDTRNLDLVFRCGGGAPSDNTLRIPVLRYYIVINSASLTRVSNNLPLPVTGLSISIDADSAHWTWSATLPLRSLADLEPDAPGELVELEAMINGLPWRLAVERIRESERFGASSLQIGGRGIAAELSDPAYPVVPHDNVAAAATAQQLADAALSFNGVPLGWALTWQAADWLVPAGAWVHSGTPLDAVVRIAAAAGAYVQAAPAARLLRVLPRYPVAPWEWGSAVPSVVLPAAAVLERGTEHVTRAAYDSVYVSGQAQGILAHVKRTGADGSRPAQMIVDQLITHADAARGRGLEVLGNTGAQQIVTLETGVLPASGVIHVGTLMDWERGAVSRRGLVRSLAVSATVPGGMSKDPVKVRQSLGVEIHG